MTIRRIVYQTWRLANGMPTRLPELRILEPGVTDDEVRRALAALEHHRCRLDLWMGVGHAVHAPLTRRRTAILGNPEARAYYERHRTCVGDKRPRQYNQGQGSPEDIRPPVIKADRDVDRVRQRYMRLSKADLVRRLLAVEQAYAEQRALWLTANDDLLAAYLRAERAEARG